MQYTDNLTQVETTKTVPDSVSDFMEMAYKKSGISEAEWQAHKGFAANRFILDKLYYYYQNLYFRCPEKFLWAGLARLTGGQVLYGMDNLVTIAKDPCALTQHIVGVAKAIFDHMAWQHECYLHDKELLTTLCKQNNNSENTAYPFAQCWKIISEDEEGKASLGNKMLLRNEQQNTIQPYYELIRKDPYSARYFWFTRFVMRSIHPHHRRFIFQIPFGDVTQFKYRWQWIDGPTGMWQTWIDCGTKERNRLVALSNEDLIHHRW